MIFLNVRTRFCCRYRYSHPSRGGDWLSSWSPPRFVLYRTRRHENPYICQHQLNAIAMEVSEFISQFQTHPVLFVGAGISKRYYEGAYSWGALLEKIASDLSGNNRLYLDLKHHATDPEGRCNFPQLASRLSRKIDEKLESQMRPGSTFSAFEISINEAFYSSVQSGDQASRLKLWVKELLSSLTIYSSKREEIKLLQEACKKVASIVTTNYDTFIEEELNFSPLVGNDILLSNPYQSVYKIHGCLTNPSSIILTEEDYSLFRHRYELIQAQLLSLFIHNPIIFMGYSIEDENIRRVLSIIFSYIAPGSNLGRRVADNFLCVQYQEGSENLDIVRQPWRMQLEDRLIDIPLNVLKTDDFASLYRALAALQLPVEAIHLKRVANVFHKIKTGGEIAVKIVGDLEDTDNRDLVLAIGPNDRISVSLDRFYYAKDAILHYFEITEQFQEGMIILTEGISQSMYFPARGLSTVFPGMEDADALCQRQDERLRDEYDRIIDPRLRSRENRSIHDINEDISIPETSKCKAIFYSAYNDKIELEDLGDYLRQKLSDIIGGEVSADGSKRVSTDVRKLLCLYDKKKYCI